MVITVSTVWRLTLYRHLCSGTELDSSKGLWVSPRSVEADILVLDTEAVWWIAVADEGRCMRMESGILLKILLSVKIVQVVFRDRYA
jgi:hypothetical protein